MVAITEQAYLILADLAYDNISTINYGNVLNEIYFPDGENLDTSFLGTKRFKDEKVRIVKDGVPEILSSALYMDVMKKWKVIAVKNLNNDTGFYGVAYENEEKEIVIAYRGTEPYGKQLVKDLAYTDGLIALGFRPEQFQFGLDFYNDIKKNNVGKEITLTGHSLGGGIAQYVSVMGSIGSAIKTRTFNGVGVVNQRSTLTGIDALLKNYSLESFIKPMLGVMGDLLDSTIGILINNMSNSILEAFNMSKNNDKYDFDLFKEQLKKKEGYLYEMASALDVVKHPLKSLIIETLKNLFAQRVNTNQDIDLQFTLFQRFEFITKYGTGEKFEGKVINYVNSHDLIGTSIAHVGDFYALDTRSDKDVGLSTVETINNVTETIGNGITTYHGFDVFLPFIDKYGKISETLTDKYLEAVIEKMIDDKWDDYASINRWMTGDTTGIYDKLITIIDNSDDLKLKDNIIKDLKEEKLTTYMTDILEKRKYYTNKIESKNAFDYTSRAKSNDVFDYLLYNSELIYSKELVTMEKESIILHSGLTTGAPTNTTKNVMIDYQNQNNTIFGTEEKDVIRINDDNSTDIGYIDNKIFAGGGIDFVSGGKGEDLIYGGAGDDWLNGGVTAGNDKDGFVDRLIGGEGDDHLFGGSGKDEYVFDLSEDSGNDVIIDTDKRGIIKIIDDGVPIEVSGTLAEDGSILKYGIKMEGFTWKYGKYDENSGTYKAQGTSISILYMNKKNVVNRITIDNFVKQYTIGGGEWLYQEEIVGLKFPSLMTGDNTIHNMMMESLMSAPPTVIGNVLNFAGMAMGFAFAMGAQVIVNVKNKACQSDPLILDLDGDGVETSAMEEGTYFDLNSDGSKEKAGWVGKDDGLLVYDKNGNGTIDSGRELFGDATRLRDGRIAESGFEALSEFDTNGDSVVDANDRGFGRLQIWQDSNSDGVSQSGELKSLGELGITSIDLKNETVNREQNGNIEVRKSTYTKSDATTGTVAEYQFLNDIFDYQNRDDIVVSEETKNMMNVNGNGLIQDLQTAMSKDETGELKYWVQTFVREKDFAIRRDLVQNEFLYEWAGVSKIDSKSRGGFIDARKLATLEKFMGMQFNSSETGLNPNKDVAPILERIYAQLLEKVYIDMMVQSHLKPYFDVIGGLKEGDNVTYDLTLAQEKIQKVIDSDFTYGKQVLHDFIAAFRIYGLDSKSNLNSFCERFASQGEDLEWIVNSAGRIKIEGTTRIETIYGRVDGLYQPVGTIERYEDNIVGTSDQDAINGHYGNDTIKAGAGDDYIYGEEGEDSLYGEDGNDLIRGGIGNDYISGGAGNDDISGGDGADNIIAGSGNDIVDGGIGNDNIKGGAGDDNYIYSYGSGNDVIVESSGNDTVIAEFLNINDVNFSNDGLDLVMTVTAIGEKLIIKDYFRSESYRVEKFQFVDGNINFDEILNKIGAIKGTNAAEALSGSTNKIVLGLDGNDFIESANIAEGGLGNDNIIGSSDNDKLYGGEGNDRLDGKIGDDYLEGESGDDLYIIRRDMGHDTIYDNSGSNNVEFVGIASTEVKLYRISNDLEFRLETQKVLTIRDYFITQKIDTIHFSDNISWTLDSLKTKTIYVEGSDLRDSINYKDDYNYSIVTFDNYDTVIAGNNKDNIDGGKGDDYLLGNNKDDVIYGGAGNDKIYGDDDSEKTNAVKDFGDILIQASSNSEAIMEQIKEITGNDNGVIFDGKAFLQKQLDEIAEGNDEMHGGFGDDYLEGGKKDDILYGDEDNDHLMGDGWVEVQTITGYVNIVYHNGNDTLYGGSGDDYLEGSKGNDKLYGGEGDDILEADGYDIIEDVMINHIGEDTLDGGLGNDTLMGGMGNDTYIFKKGYNHDEIIEIGGDDTLDMQGILASEATFTREMNTLKISVGESEQIKLTDYFLDKENGDTGYSFVETIKFSDTTMSYMDVLRKMGIIGTSGNDSISGNEKDNIIFGESGDDVITDDLGMDRIYGGTGNDIIYSGMENDVIFGEEGKDTIYGGYGNDTIKGGYGNDNLYGGENNDYIEGNEGNDYIDGGYGKDKIYGGTGNDIINSSGDDDIVYGNEGDDILLTESGDDKVYGGDGDDVLITGDGDDKVYGEEGSDVIKAGEGNDYIISDKNDIENYGNDKVYAAEGDDYIKTGAGDDYLDGNVGADIMIGGKGADTYVFGIGYGTDTIMEGGDLSVDTIEMTEGVTKDNLAIKFKKYDLILTIKDTNDKLVISDYFRKDENKIERIKFFDGTEMDLKSLTDQWIIKGTAGNDILHGTEFDDLIFGYQGDDVIYGYGGNDTLNGGEGNDLLFGGTGNDYLDGETGNDVLDGGSGDDELEGGAGDDIYVFAKGYDRDVIIEDRETNPSDKTIVQINDIAPSKVSFMKVFDNLEIYAEGTAARLVINDFFKDNRNKIDEIQFTDGTIWSLEDIKNRPISIVGTGDDDFFKANRVTIDNPDTIYRDHSDYRFIANAGDGDDIIETGSKNDVIYGEAGNDSIKGMGGNDILRGGIGNDSISGGLGNDIISGDEENDNLYGDEGNDTIDGGQGNDYIDGGAGDDLIIDNEGNNKIDGGQGNDKINTGSGNDYVSGGAGKDIISTYNGNDSISGDEGNDSIYAGEGNDIISGGSGDDLIDAGLGDDIISGNEGDDYYYFGKGDGHDTITEEGWGFDKIVFKDNVLISDVKIMKNIFDLIISIVDINENITDSITVKNYFNSPYKMVERILFANGTEWDSFDVSEKLKIIGTSGDDIITGTEYGDLIYAEDGNDAVNALGDNDGIRGGLGNDTIHGNTGDDYIYGEAGSDTLYGDEGDDVIEGASGNDIVYGGLGNDIISSGDDKDTVYGEAGNDSIRGGTGNDRIEGGLGNDIIYGNEDSDELYGQEGMDTIYGGEGNDTIEGGVDNDFIEGGYGSDILNGGSGDDRIVGYVSLGNTSEYSNDDKDIIHGNDGNDSISAGYGDDEVYGDSGNDFIDGEEGKDILFGGSGDDTIIGGSGDDTIDGGDGNDYINGIIGYTNGDGDFIELSDNDQIQGGSGDDTIIDGLGDTEVYGDSGNDGIRTGAGDDIIHGGEGNDRLYGESGFDIIYGDSGNDELYGGIDSDVLEGGIGNDYLEGGTGEDKYVFGLGFGQDVIVDYDKSLENIDKIVFKPEITSSMLDLSRDVYNLIMKVKNTSDMITIKDYFKDEYSKIEVIEFADGTLWGAEKIRERVGIFYGTDLGEEILGSDVNNLMYGLGGADKLYGKEGDDIIEGGLGDDYIEGNEGKDDLKGGLGNDIISGGLDDDLIKGDDGNDSLYGDSGNDTIYGDIGDDKICGGDGSDVIYTGKGNDIAYGDAGDDRIVDEFGDDKIFGGEGNDSIDVGSGDDYVEGGLGNDRISLGAGIDLAYGGEGNDVIAGDLSDTVYGDVGDDNISGVYKAFGGEGNDVINSSIAYGDNGNDSISVTANGFAFGGEGDDSLTGSGGSESLEGGLGNDIIYGNDGNDLLLGQDGNDKLYGGYGDDRLDGGVGNDYLEDISGNDLYFFGSDYGNDIIYDKNGSLDRIKFGVGISQNSLNFSNIGYDLVISIKESEDTLTIKDYFKSQEYQIEKFEFFDGSIFKVNDSIKDMNFSEVIGTAENDILYGVKNISGLDGNDNITGSILADTITGGLGNDILVGGLGNDKYVLSSGDGSDTITDFEDTSNNSDTIYINGTKTNYNIKRENYNLIISSNLNQDKITVVNYYLSDAYKIENVNFSDGTLFSKDDLINLTLLGTDKNDSLIGGYGNDIINGLKGDDYLEGKTGNDTYIYGKGYGNDTIFDEGGVDVIKLLEGVSPEEVTLRQVDSNLQLVIETTGEILTIKDYYNPYSDKKIESIVFSDSTSTTWNNEIIAQKRIYKFGDISDNMIDGSDKSDSIYGWEGNDVLNGGAGNDLIFGGYGNDRLTGGVGSDVLDGSYGDDTYYISFDNAKDLIRDSQGTDTIKFSKDLTADIVRVQRNNSNLDIYAKTSDNTESIIATIENYYTSPYWWDPNAFKVENLQFADKTVWDVNTVDQKAYTFIGNESDEVLGGYDHSLNIIANEGNDTLKGSRYNDTFNGGLGNDLIEGGYGSDTYLFNKGDGKDTISDNSYAGYWGVGDNGTDKIKFGENITLNDIILVKKGNNLELRLKDISNISKDSITVSDYFRKEDRYWAYGGTYSPYTIEQMEFNDGKIINIAELLSPGVLIGDATSGADTLETGVAINSIIYGEAGNDTLIGNNAIDTLYGGDDSDLLVSNDGNDILYGGTGNDTLKAGNGNDFLEGDAGTDRLEGNFGSDVYFFEKGFGIDTIKDDGYSGYWGTGDTGTDKLKFGADIALNDILLAKKGNNLELRFNNIDKLNTDKIIIEDYFKREERYWAYGGAFDPYKIEKVELSNGDVIDLTSMFTKGIIIDEITENADVVNMNIQYDGLIFGGKGNDQITGNSGNDKLYGEEDNDILSGGAGDDILSGGLGNDIIDSGTGNNVIIYNLGEGIDTIKISANSNNTLKLGEGILRENVVITREGHNLVIFDGQSTDKVIVENWYYGKKLNEIQFADGSSMDLSTLHNQGLVVRGTENADEILGEGTENDELHGESGNDTLHGLLGNDTLYGESGDDAINGGEGNDIIVGGTGNDNLQGGANDDLYIFNKEDGQDIIYDHLDRVNKYWWGTTTDVNYYNAGSDTIKFGEGIVKEDLWVKLDGNNLQIGIKNADKSFDELSDKITIKDFKNSNSRIEFLEFSNGVKLELPNIISLLGTTLDDNVLWEETSVNLSTLDGNDNITTGSYDDIIDLGRGNDKLNSGAGQDIVHGNEGNDTIFTSTGNDLVYGEDGEDTIDGGEGNDSLYGGNGNDTLTGGTGDDLISGGSGKDILIGNLGSNIYAFNLGDGEDTIKSTIGSFDIIQFGEGVFKDNILFTREGHNLIVRTSNAVDKIVVENWYLGNKLEKILFADGTEILKEEIHTKGLVVKDTLVVNQLTGEASENDVLYGLDGDDAISGGFGNDTLFGNSDNDTLSGNEGNDILVGGIGADILSGGSGNNIYEFSLGDGQDIIKSTTGSSDTLKLSEGMTRENISFTREGHNLIIRISNGTDKITVENWYLGNKLEKILFADGTEMLKEEIHTKGLVVKGTTEDDTLNGVGSESDVLYGLSGNDTINGLSGDDILFGGDGQDIINAGIGNDTAHGQLGNDIIYGNEGNDILQGNEGDDSLSGDNGNDILEGGKGKDILSGGSGNNTYVFNLGDGEDTIKLSTDTDIIKFGEGITKDSIVLTREGLNLIIYTPNTEDKIVVENWYLSYKLSKIVFSDGSEILKEEIHTKGLVVKGTSSNDKIEGLNNQNDVLYGLSGDDVIEGLSGDDIISGNEGNDTIGGGLGNDILEGGKGKDILSGGSGNNTYIFNLGDGEDTVKLSTNTDIIKFGEGITKDSIVLTREGLNLIIYTPNTEDKIVVENWYLSYKLSKIVFSDGSEILKEEIHTKGLVVKGTSSNDKIEGLNNYNDVLYGLSGDDVIEGLSGDDIISGNEGNDTLSGGFGSDILEGGKGKDTLIGGAGKNTYVFNLGDGEDTVKLSTNVDIIKFGEGITKDNIVLTREGLNLIIYTPNTEDKIVVENWYSSYKLSKIVFSDGSEILKEEIHTKGLVVKGTVGKDELLGLEYENNVLHGMAGDDTIKGGNSSDFLYGNEGNDIINGEYGDDYIEGGQGNDTIHVGYGKNTIKYSLGDGDDTILNAYGEDNLILNNIKLSDVKDIIRVGQDSKDVLLTFKNGETIKLISQNISNIETFTFAEKVLSSSEFIRLIVNISGSNNNDNISGYETSEIISGGIGDDSIYGDAGNDLIYGGLGEDAINGGLGNDILDGGEGNDFLQGESDDDTYIFRINNGNDIIQEDDDFGNSDKIILEGLNKSDITLERIENTLIIIMNKTGETLTINDYFGGVRNKVENIVFQDGSIWDKESVKDYLGYDKNSFSLILNSDNSYNVNFKKYNIKFGVKIFKGDDGLLHSETSFNYSNNSQERLFETLKLKKKIEVQINNYLDQLLKSNIPLDILSESFNERFDEIREITVQCLEFREDFKEDAVLGNLKSLNLEGDTDENLLEGDILEDILDGGLGNDVLIGKSGNDTYIFGKGYGEDTILDFDSDKNSQDVIQMRDIASSEAVLTRNNFDLEISCGQDKLIVKNYFDGLRFKIEKIEFSDNVTWTREDINFKLEQNIDMYSIKVENDSLFKVDFKVGKLSITLNFSLENGILGEKISISRYDSDLAECNAFIASKEYKILSSQVLSLVSQFTESNMPLSNWKTNLVNDMDNLKELIAQNLIYSDINFDYSIVTSNLLSTDGDDSLRGTNKGDILDGGLGNDILEGGLGNDKYIFAKGYGEDTIIENDSTTNNLDIIEMKDITSEEAILSKEGLNLLITCGNDKLIVQDYFSSVSNKIEKIVFSDGITYLNADIESKIGISKNDFNISIISDSNFLFSFTRSEVKITVIYLNGKFGYQLSGFQEAIDNFNNSGEKGILSSQVSEYVNQIVNSDIDLNNCISSIENNMDFINNIIKNSFKIEAIVEGSPEPEKLEYIGTDLNDIFTGNSNNEIFDGKLGDDTLEGKAGDDTYIFGKGYGVDTIYEDDFTIGNIDTLKLKDILLSEIIALRNGDNLEIAITNSTDKVILNNYFGNSNNKIEKIEFADGTILDNKTLYQMMGLNVSGYRVAVTDVGFTLVFNTMNVEVSTKFYIDSSNQLKYNMPTFKYDSVDEFNNFGSTGWPKCNAQLNNLISILSNSGIDLVSLKSSIQSNEELFRNILTQTFEFKQEAKTSYLTQEISYEGNVAIPENLNVLGSSSSNILTGNRGNDTLDGLAGNDMLDGGTGNDTYIFGKGYGIDTIYENDSTVGNIDTLKFKDVLLSEVAAVRSGNNLEISIINSSDKVILNNYFSNSNSKIERIEFSDGYAVDKKGVYQMMGLNVSGYRVSVTDTYFIFSYNTMNVEISTKFYINSSNELIYDMPDFKYETVTEYNNFGSTGWPKCNVQLNNLLNKLYESKLDFTNMKDVIKNNEELFSDMLTQIFEFKQETKMNYLTQEISYQGDTTVPANMNVLGSSSSNILTGDRGNDILDGLAGNDLLDGGTGNDTYIFGKGYGIDTIYESDSTAGNTDKIKLKDVNFDEVELKKVGNNLEVIISGTTDKIIVNNYYASTNNKVEQIEFMDGTIWNPDNVITGTTNADTLSGKVIQSGLAGNDTLTGTTSADTLYGGLGNDSLDGATANDNLYGGLGNDTYIFGKGYGIDTIYENDSTSGNIDKVKFKDVNPDGVELKQVGNNLEISISGTTDKIVINNYFVSGNNKVEQIEFMDGTIWNPENVLVGTASADTLSGKSIISGLAGDDTINGSLTDDMLYGGAGIDTITGNAGNDIIDGGIGNDSLNGGLGNDTYIFAKGYGTDTITDLDSTIGNIDTIKMRDITSTIAVAARNGNNLEITATGFTDKLIVSNYFSGTNNKVEKVVFSDNIVWDKNMINQKAGLNVTNYNLELKGTTFDLTFVRDNVTVKTTFSVVGGAFTASTPAYSGTTTNLNAFTAAKKTIVTNQITQFKTDFINAGLGLTDWNNQLTANSRILNEIISQSFEFKGTSVVDTMTATTNNMFLSGGSGADVITGNTGNDVLIGGAGNDTLKGAAGNDTYIFGRGDGIDTVTDTAGADILRINANPLDLIFAQTGTDLDISINGTTDKVTVKSWFSGATNQIEKIVANDTELLLNTSVQGMIQAMSAFDSGNQMTWSQSIQNKPKETNDVLSQYWGHQTTMVK